MQLQIDEALGRLLLEVDLHEAIADVADLEDAAERLVVDVGVAAVALVLVVPVDHVHRAVGAVAEVQHLAPRVVGVEEVLAVGGGIAGAAALQHVDVGAMPVNVVHEDRAAVFRRPAVAAEVDHRAGVSVAAAGRIRSAVAGVRPVLADPVHVVGHRLDVVEDVGVEVPARLPLVACAGNHVVEVLDHAGGREGVAVVVEVESPRIARALGEHLEGPRRRVIAPDRPVQPLALGVRSAGLADVRVREDAVRAVEPAVRTPREGVEHLVRVLIAPAVEQHLRRSRGQIGAALDRNEQEIRRRADEQSTESVLQPADEIQPLDEHLPAVEPCRRRWCPRRSRMRSRPLSPSARTG